MPGKPTPTPTATTQPYWDAAGRRTLSVQQCRTCFEHVFYPRIYCPFCGSDDLAWVECSGRATLESYVINHVTAPGFDRPHIIALVRLAEGPRMMSSLVGVAANPDLLQLDMPLQVDFEQREDCVVPVFAPVPAVAATSPSALDTTEGVA